MGQTLNIQIHSFHTIRFYLNTNFIIINILSGLVGSSAFPITILYYIYTKRIWVDGKEWTAKENSLNSEYPVFCWFLKFTLLCSASYVDMVGCGFFRTHCGFF